MGGGRCFGSAGMRRPGAAIGTIHKKGVLIGGLIAGAALSMSVCCLKAPRPAAWSAAGRPAMTDLQRTLECLLCGRHTPDVVVCGHPAALPRRLVEYPVAVLLGAKLYMDGRVLATLSA